jgi:integrase
MGSVYRKRKGGRELGWYAAYIDLNGKRRHVVTKQPTKAAARIFLAEIEARVRRGLIGVPEPSARSSLTVAELCERWLDERGGPKVEGRRRSARTCLGRVLPRLGSLVASQLTRAQVKALVTELSQRYAPNTVRVSLETLASVLNLAVREGLLPVNVARGVQLPRREVAIEWLDVAESARLLTLAEQRSGRSLRDGVRYVAIALGLLCGLRRGEIFGLRWCDIDLAAQRLTVARSYDGTPKSGATRHLPLPDELVPILAAWQPRCPRSAMGLVCPVLHRGRWGLGGERTDHGLPALLTDAACKPLRRGWHGLRHTFASLFVQAGGDLFALSKLLGHADVRETQVYAHLSPSYLLAERSRLRIRT